ncbi:LacI family DNA-binding transcriptional regulator [Paenibacillus sp. D2_2]|uniref:LacI family DNA-binding transcriptional regulator n=1 Tax=Paenibacillus sp. D2_2 TaxID=3073092 RepID=UPI0028152234|nr:LacI family DNA-binding transcriptional regulator [Paenibacillus sp. D2_2]WMT41713.1 LacI family DNA-binding transcriptional regulator [Paenibacillus sp. D2_2]
MKKSDINSIEIAKIAGVSRSTVSRVINNYPNVPKATRDKVMQVIEQYKYSPNFSARIMSGMKTQTIGLFMISPEEVFHDSLTTSLITGLIESASNQGYYVLTHIIRNTKDQDIVRKVKETFYQQRIDGGIFIGAANHETLIEELIAEGYFVGIIDQNIEGRYESNRVVCNFGNVQGMKQGVDYLAGLNHRKIAFITGDPLRCSGPEKLEGFKNAMVSHGLEVDSRWIIPSDFTEKGGYSSVRQWLKTVYELPTAIFACNDSVAFGALAALKEADLIVPDQISLIGFDDHALSSRIQPGINVHPCRFYGNGTYIDQQHYRSD